jgi:hypothetical protein
MDDKLIYLFILAIILISSIIFGSYKQFEGFGLFYDKTNNVVDSNGNILYDKNKGYTLDQFGRAVDPDGILVDPKKYPTSAPSSDPTKPPIIYNPDGITSNYGNSYTPASDKNSKFDVVFKQNYGDPSISSFNYDSLYNTSDLTQKYSFLNSSYFYAAPPSSDNNDYLSKIYFKNNPLELEQMCKNLDPTVCGLISSCVYLGQNKCIPGNASGPFVSYSDINVDYYYYKGTCYGHCPGEYGISIPTPTPTLNPTLTPTLNPTLTPTLNPSPTPTKNPSPTPTKN